MQLVQIGNKIHCSLFIVHCADSQGDVLVYDHANQTASLFCMDGTFVKKLLIHDVGFNGFSVFQNQYLLGNNITDGLYLYKI